MKVEVFYKKPECLVMSSNNAEEIQNIIPSINLTETIKTPQQEELAKLPKEEEEREGFKNVSGFDQLKEKAPEVYQASLRGIANRIITDMKRSQERVKKAIKGQQ